MSCDHGHTRRGALRLIGGGALILGAPALSGCSGGPETGPVEVAWDRDTCELCRMIIGDARFTAQVHGGDKRKIYKFDDIGCVVNWLNDKSWAAAKETEIWVADNASTRQALVWLPAREAFYQPGLHSPMNYNFGAFKDNAPERVPFERVTNKILADIPNHICPVPGRSTAV